MVTVQITKAQAILLLAPFCGSKERAAFDVESLVLGARHGLDAEWFTHNACKVGAVRTGCVIRFFLAGNARDGSDVRNVMARIVPRPTVRWGEQMWDKSYCDVARSSRSHITHMNRQSDCRAVHSAERLICHVWDALSLHSFPLRPAPYPTFNYEVL